MTYFLHSAKGTQADGSFWSFGLVTSGAISEAAAESGWSGAVAGFFSDAAVVTYYTAGTTLTGTASSTASSTFHQTTKTSTSLSHVGTSVADQLPMRLTVILSLYSAQATRYGRGRIKLPAPSSNVLSTDNKGMIDAAIGANIAAAAASMFGALGTAGLTPVLVTRRKTVSGVAQYSTRDITSGLLWHHFGTLRRRADKIVPASSAFAT